MNTSTKSIINDLNDFYNYYGISPIRSDINKYILWIYWDSIIKTRNKIIPFNWRGNTIQIRNIGKA